MLRTWSLQHRRVVNPDGDLNPRQRLHRINPPAGEHAQRHQRQVRDDDDPEDDAERDLHGFVPKRDPSQVSSRPAAENGQHVQRSLGNARLFAPDLWRAHGVAGHAHNPILFSQKIERLDSLFRQADDATRRKGHLSRMSVGEGNTLATA